MDDLREILQALPDDTPIIFHHDAKEGIFSAWLEKDGERIELFQDDDYQELIRKLTRYFAEL